MQPSEVDLGGALVDVARSLNALRVSPQTFGLDRRVDRAGYLALARLADLGTARLTELAGVLGLDLSTVSRQVRALEEADLVVRTTDPEDRRAAMLAATPAGLDLVAAMKAAFSRLIDAAMTDWSERDRRNLTTLLSRLAGDLRPDRASHLLASATGKS